MFFDDAEGGGAGVAGLRALQAWMQRRGTAASRLELSVCACALADGAPAAVGRAVAAGLGARADCPLDRLRSLELDLSFHGECAVTLARAPHAALVPLPRGLAQLDARLDSAHLLPDLAPLSALTALRLLLHGQPARGALALPPSLRRLALSLLPPPGDADASLPPGIAAATRLESLALSWGGSTEDHRLRRRLGPPFSDLSLLDASRHAWCRQLTDLGLSEVAVEALPAALPPELRTLEMGN